MEIAQERNLISLVGEFVATEYEGEITNVLIFIDEHYGRFAIGGHKTDSIELKVPYQITVAARGKAKRTGNKTYTSNCLYLKDWKKLVSNKTSENKRQKRR